MEETSDDAWLLIGPIRFGNYVLLFSNESVRFIIKVCQRLHSWLCNIWLECQDVKKNVSDVNNVPALKEVVTNMSQFTVYIINKCIFWTYFCSIDVLADNGRLTLTGDVISAFSKMMSAHRGEVICTVTTAKVCL